MANLEHIYTVTTMLDRTLASLVAGKFTRPDHYDRVIDGDTNVYRKDGSLLLAFRKSAVPSAAWRTAFGAIYTAAKPTDPLKGRKDAAGGQREFRSGTEGFMRGKLLASTPGDKRGWNQMQPLLRAIDAVFGREIPQQCEAHRELIAGIPARCLVPFTSFTTVACNRTARMAYHRDKNNVEGCYGALSVAGQFSGGLLVFPRYRVAVNLRPGDVLVADNTEVHGNTPIAGERLSVVCFAHTSNLLG